MTASLKELKTIHDRVDERMMVAASCSLLHGPANLENKKRLNPELKNWLSFEVQKY